MNIHLATTDANIATCYQVMRELRPHLAEDQFLPRVRDQMLSGYRLAYVEEAGGAVAVAGFRVAENLAWGRFLYVDDLVTLPAYRSRGHGASLLAWLREYAAREGCQQLHLDSGVHRKGAHRFYQREGMVLAGHHFSENISSAPMQAGSASKPALAHLGDAPAQTPAPPYYAVIFTSVRADGDAGYAETAERMVSLASTQPGFLGFETARQEVGISVSYWATLEAIQAWKENAAHRLAQGRARDWYRTFRVRVCRVEREYGF